MAPRIFNEYSRRNTVGFWITTSIGIVLLICLLFLLVNYMIVTF